MDLGLQGKVALVMAASKGLGRAVATELVREGSRVVISSRDEETLSTARSRSMDASRADTLSVPVEEVRGKVKSQIPLGRYGTPEEFARVASFLASPANT